MAGLLATSQLLTIAILWPRPIPSEEPMVTGSTVLALIDTAPATPPDSGALWLLTRQVVQSPQSEIPSPSPIDHVVAADRPLYAGNVSAAIN
jgi:hypothetical protein